MRPHYHFTPPQNFMNDPIGLVFYQGEYHLFYQHNPFGQTWGHMSWGHAVSRDLMHWEHLPVALSEENGVMIFSGSAVVDWQNTSGFGRVNVPPLIAIYTGQSDREQTQNMAYSADCGRTWTKYAGNPIIAINSREFRDPKVFWHTPTRQWVMVSVLADQRQVRFDGSLDLRHWRLLSSFGPAGAVDGPWECPDLFPLPVEGQPTIQKWVLKVDVLKSIGAQYFIGDFDGVRFVNDAPSDRILQVDYGKDFYAAQSWSDILPPDGRRVWVVWMSNWDYASVTPTSPWRGTYSIPRDVRLRLYPEGLQLIQRPIDELTESWTRVCHCAEVSIAAANAELAARGQLGPALVIQAEFEPSSALEFGVRVQKSDSEETVIGYDVRAAELFIDRRRSGNTTFSPVFPEVHRAPLPLEAGKIAVRLFIDSCSVEVFGNDGRVVMTDLIFPAGRSTAIELYSLGGQARVATLDVWKWL